jgi:hypothetical protein
MSHPTSSTPSLLISTRATPLLRFAAYDASANEAAFAGVDLDATDERRRTLVAGRSLTRAIASPSVRSVWLRPAQLEGTGLTPLAATAIATGHGRDRLLVVIDVPADVDRGEALSAQIAAAKRIRATSDRPLDISIAVRADNPDGSRLHLERLSLVRHICAEWDLRVALDLVHAPDPTWEAEAAIALLLTRLAMVRIAVPRTVLSGGARWRITSRAVATITDGGYRGYLSLVPELSLLEKRSAVAITHRCASFAANVERRAIRQQNDRARRTGRRQVNHE